MFSEKFSLKWKDYQSNWCQSLSRLRNDTDMSDVTLITDDMVKISAHKILLSSCSNVFNYILKDHNQSNLLLYLSGISSVSLGFILDYIYHGEVNLYQEQLDGFLDSAQKLEISGLLSESQGNEDEPESVFDDIKDTNDIFEYEDQKNRQENHWVGINDESPARPRSQVQHTRNIPNNVPNCDVTGMSSEEIGDKIKTMYQKINGVWTCNVCGRTSYNKSTDMRLHVETHLDGLCYTCTQCNQDFRLKSLLKKHKQKTNHK